MYRANRKFLYRSSIFLFLLACTEDELTTITNPIDLPIPDYKLNLQNTNSGSFTNTVTIEWDPIESDSIYINSAKIIPDSSSYTFVDMTPGEFRDISIEVFTIDSIYVDNMQIYTRSVYPVTDFAYITEVIYAINTFFDFNDQNGNGKCDYTGSLYSGDFESDECEPFYDGNGVYDEGEDKLDSDNGFWDNWEYFTDSENGSYDPWEEYEDGNGEYDIEEEYEDGNGVYDFGENFIDSEIGDYTSWEQFIDSINTDGEYDIWEAFTDSDDGVWNAWEDFTDSKNGSYDPWEDYQDGNDVYDFGENFTDSDDGVWNAWEDFTDSKNGSYDPWEDFQDGNEQWDFYADLNEDEKCDYTGSWDSGDFESDECEPFQDGDGKYSFQDQNGDGKCDYTGSLDSGDFESDECEPFTDSRNHILDSWENFIDEPSLRNNVILSWIPTEEETFSHYIIYRVTKENGDLLKNLDNCNCQIDNLPINMNDRLTNEYIESDSILTQTVAIQPEPDSFYYRFRVVTNEGYTRDSYIHYSGFPKPESITLTENDVSTDREEYVEIRWEPDSTYAYTYQYEIWRSSNEVISDTSRLIIIPDWEIDHFRDRDVGSGTSWYYSVAIQDISGRIIFSNFIRGLAKP